MLLITGNIISFGIWIQCSAIIRLAAIIAVVITVVTPLSGLISFHLVINIVVTVTITLIAAVTKLWCFF